jgi:DnaJ-domain-containing protein 1
MGQTSFGFDVFEATGWAFHAEIPDHGKAERERKARLAREAAERAERERKAKERADRAERERRAQSQYSDPWQVLGVSMSASKAEIRKAWAAMVLNCHPDKHGGDDAAIKRINAAYNKLKRSGR